LLLGRFPEGASPVVAEKGVYGRNIVGWVSCQRRGILQEFQLFNLLGETFEQLFNCITFRFGRTPFFVQVLLFEISPKEIGFLSLGTKKG
jgi:hypothetical protein